jgi:hypothetical protein
MPKRNGQQRRAVALTPNRAAVVIHLTVGTRTLLLGADLEDGGGPTLGWRAVVSSTTRPQSAANVYKVAHHGSANGHNGDVWSKMLTPTPYALVTPFSSGRRFLPAEDDIARLNALTPHAYCTAQPGGVSPRRREPAVERTLREVAPLRRAGARAKNDPEGENDREPDPPQWGTSVGGWLAGSLADDGRSQESSSLVEPAYSMTLSARPSTEGGIVSLSALAVLRLMTSSNFVGCSTGRAAGLAPFRILST